MPKLGIERSGRNGDFFERVARYNEGVKIDVEGNQIVLKGKKIEIPRKIFDEVFASLSWEEKDRLWNSLQSPAEGKVKEKGYSRILIEDY
jgi:hypothetical protein